MEIESQNKEVNLGVYNLGRDNLPKMYWDCISKQSTEKHNIQKSGGRSMSRIRCLTCGYMITITEN